MIDYLDMNKYSDNRNLLGSEKGKKILEKIHKELNNLPMERVLLLDFSNIRYATSDCLTEILNVIDRLKRWEFKDKYILLKLKSTNVSLMNTFCLVLKEKRTVIPSIDEKKNLKFLGKLTKCQKETIDLIKKEGKTTSNDISKLLDIPISAASNRLKDLYNQKLLMREEKTLSTGGREFIYTFVGVDGNGKKNTKAGYWGLS